MSQRSSAVLDARQVWMAAIGDDAAGAFIFVLGDEDNIDTEGTIDPKLKYIH